LFLTHLADPQEINGDDSHKAHDGDGGSELHECLPLFPRIGERCVTSIGHEKAQRVQLVGDVTIFPTEAAWMRYTAILPRRRRSEAT